MVKVLKVPSGGKAKIKVESVIEEVFTMLLNFYLHRFQEQNGSPPAKIKKL